MSVRTHTGGITFRVDEVTPASNPLETHKTQESIAFLAEGTVEACSDYTTDCVKHVGFQPVLAAACLAHADHRPLVLSPDMIWLTILQGFAQHIRNDPERFRDRLVSHSGKAIIEVSRPDFAKGSAENPWDEVIAAFSAGVRERVGENYDALVSDFSTTGPVERTACEVTLLDTFSSYFELMFYCVCGIPEITLEGTEEDWRKLRAKVEHLAPFDLDWWLPSVRQVCDEFSRAASGECNREVWRNLWKQYKRYGGSDVNGWLVKLVPYIQHYESKNFTIRNPLLDDDEARIATSVLPSGVARAEFRCTWSDMQPRAYEMLGGFLGVEQKPKTLALRPKMGWAVRPASEQTQLYTRLAAHGAKPPLPPLEFDQVLSDKREEGTVCEFPGDFGAFFKACDGAALFPNAVGKPAFRFRGLSELEGVPSPFPKKRFGPNDEVDIRGPFVRVCDLADGRFAAFEMKAVSEDKTDGRGREYFWPVVLIDPARPSPAPPVVAWSFSEFVRLVLESGGRLDALTDRSTEHKTRS
jgi:hypothetical protein